MGFPPLPPFLIGRVNLERPSRRRQELAFAGRSPATTESPPGPRSGRAVKERGLALADADAERREPVAAVAAPELVQECHDEAGAAHAERMPERDRAAVDVHALRVETELTDDDEAL